MRRLAVLLALVLAGCCCDPCRRSCCPNPCPCPCSPCGAPATVAAAPAAPTLFDRLGGMKGLEALVDDFLPRLFADQRVMGNKEVAARMGKADPKAARDRFVQQMCFLSGGPCAYVGRDMKTAHTGLGITKAEWEASVEDFKASLAKLKIGEKEGDELLAKVLPFQKDVVEKP